MTIWVRWLVAWQVYDAKARFSEFLEKTLAEGPQVVTRRGVETAVLVPIDEWKHLKEREKQSIPDPLLDPNAPHDIPLGPRRGFKLRPFIFDDAE
jgi:prevent-host-death family protein